MTSYVGQVHERSVDGDFLLLELKELLMRHSSLKVILMSATINEETFVKYFDDAPLLTIPGFTHPVTDKSVEDMLNPMCFHLIWHYQIPRRHHPFNTLPASN